MSLSSTPVPDRAEQDLPAAVSVPDAEPEPAAAGRHRHHRFPARKHALKVLYGDDEHATILRAAQIAGLRPSGYVAAAALTMAEQVLTAQPVPAGGVSGEAAGRRRRDTLTPLQDRELLAELLQARLALHRYAVNVNQVAAALNSGRQAPVWLSHARRGRGPGGDPDRRGRAGTGPPPALTCCSSSLTRCRARVAAGWARVGATSGKAAASAEGRVGKNFGKGGWSSSAG